MVKSLTNLEILKLWFKATLVAFALAMVVQGITSFMRNGNEHLPSTKECHELTQLHKTGTKFKSFEDFYPFYLCEHSLGTTKLFHFIATTNALFIDGILLTRKWQTKLFMFTFVQAYGLAWFSHFLIERNRPATWTYPTYSFFGDFRMFYDVISLKFPPFFENKV